MKICKSNAHKLRLLKSNIFYNVSLQICTFYVKSPAKRMMARDFASYTLDLRKRETGDLIDNRKASLRKYLLTVETRRIGNEEGTSRGKERSARVSRRGGGGNGRVKGNRDGGKERGVKESEIER